MSVLLLASDFDKSKYLRAEDLKGPTKLRIKETTGEVFNNKNTGKPEKKLVVWFTTIDQGLVLNKTNNRTIRGAFGDPLGGWENRIVVVFPTTTDVGGKVTPCLRVRIPRQPAAPQQPVTPGNDAAAAPPVTTAATSAASAVVAVAPLAAPAAPPAPSGSVVTMTRGAVSPAAPAAVDPDLVDDPEPDDDMDDEIPF